MAAVPRRVIEEPPIEEEEPPTTRAVLVTMRDAPTEPRDPPWRPAMRVHYSSQTSEHFTPRVILDAVIACMGGIDLDPCSNPGEPNVPAGQHFTEEHDGLNQDWHASS